MLRLPTPHRKRVSGLESGSFSASCFFRFFKGRTGIHTRTLRSAPKCYELLRKPTSQTVYAHSPSIIAQPYTSRSPSFITKYGYKAFFESGSHERLFRTRTSQTRGTPFNNIKHRCPLRFVLRPKR
uniref:Uncharacterized protein n=1 Tax=Haemonchus placei TaxID=6290 RepID=A0A0N4W3C1_HAEPC